MQWLKLVRVRSIKMSEKAVSSRTPFCLTLLFSSLRRLITLQGRGSIGNICALPGTGIIYSFILAHISTRLVLLSPFSRRGDWSLSFSSLFSLLEILLVLGTRRQAGPASCLGCHKPSLWWGGSQVLGSQKALSLGGVPRRARGL